MSPLLSLRDPDENTARTSQIKFTVWGSLAAVSLLVLIILLAVAMLKPRPLNGPELGFAAVPLASLAAIFVIAICNLPIGERWVFELETVIVKSILRQNAQVATRILIKATAGLFTFVLVYVGSTYLSSAHAANPHLERVKSAIDEEIGKTVDQNHREISWAVDRLKRLRSELKEDSVDQSEKKLIAIQDYVHAVKAFAAGNPQSAIDLSEQTRAALPEAMLVRWYAILGGAIVPNEDLLEIVSFAQKHPRDRIADECRKHAIIMLHALVSSDSVNSDIQALDKLIQTLRSEPGSSLLLSNSLAARSSLFMQCGKHPQAISDIFAACAESKASEQFSVLRPKSVLFLTIAACEIMSTADCTAETRETLEHELCTVLNETFNDTRYQKMSSGADYDTILMSILEQDAVDPDDLRLGDYCELLSQMHQMANVLYRHELVSKDTLDKLSIMFAVARFSHSEMKNEEQRLGRDDLLKLENANETLRSVVNSKELSDDLASRLNASFAGTCLGLAVFYIHNGRVEVNHLRDLVNDCTAAMDRISKVPETVKDALEQIRDLALIEAKRIPPELENHLRLSSISERAAAIIATME